MTSEHSREAGFAVRPVEPWAQAGFARAVRRGRMLWLSGHFGEVGDARRDDDFAAEVADAVAALLRTAEKYGFEDTDLVKLLCFYVDDVERDAFMRMLREALPAVSQPAVTAVPVPYLSVPGARVLVEGYAMREPDGAELRREALRTSPAEPFPTAVRCGQMIFVGAQDPVPAGNEIYVDDILGQTRIVMRRIGDALRSFGADFDDVVKLNRWYVGSGSVEDFEPAALACGAHFREPGPAATGIPVPRLSPTAQLITIEVVAMLGEDGKRLQRRHVWPDSLWDWTIKLPYHHGLKCHDMIFLGGQVSLDRSGRAVHPDQMVEQTGQAMDHIETILRELGADLDDVCKLTTMYAADPVSERHEQNLAVRVERVDGSTTAATDVPLPVLAYPAMIIEIDAFAMAEPDRHDIGQA